MPNLQIFYHFIILAKILDQTLKLYFSLYNIYFALFYWIMSDMCVC